MTLPSWRSSTVMTFLLRERLRGRTTRGALWFWLEGLNSNKPDIIYQGPLLDFRPHTVPLQGFIAPSIQLQLLSPHDNCYSVSISRTEQSDTFYLHRASPAFSLPEKVRPLPVRADPFPSRRSSCERTRQQSHVLGSLTHIYCPLPHVCDTP